MRVGVDHAVFMGMGEPMMNLDAVLGACERLPDTRDHAPAHGDLDGRLGPRDRAPDGVGHAGAPRALAARARGRAAQRADAVNERYPLADVLGACRAHWAATRRRVFVEYVMLAGVNDRYEQALALARAARHRARRSR